MLFNHTAGKKMKFGVREKNEKRGKKEKGKITFKKALKCIFLGYKLKKNSRGLPTVPAAANLFDGEKIELEEGGREMIRMHNIYDISLISYLI